MFDLFDICCKRGSDEERRSAFAGTTYNLFQAGREQATMRRGMFDVVRCIDV